MNDLSGWQLSCERKDKLSTSKQNHFSTYAEWYHNLKSNYLRNQIIKLTRLSGPFILDLPSIVGTIFWSYPRFHDHFINSFNAHCSAGTSYILFTVACCGSCWSSIQMLHAIKLPPISLGKCCPYSQTLVRFSHHLGVHQSAKMFLLGKLSWNKSISDDALKDESMCSHYWS